MPQLTPVRQQRFHIDSLDLLRKASMVDGNKHIVCFI
jgi:hypothetical protein